MADFNEKLWHGTRTYMMSGRTNPPPPVYIDTLEKLLMTVSERGVLIGRVNGWPGGNPAIKAATVADIMKAKVMP